MIHISNEFWYLFHALIKRTFDEKAESVKSNQRSGARIQRAVTRAVVSKAIAYPTPTDCRAALCLEESQLDAYLSNISS